MSTPDTPEHDEESRSVKYDPVDTIFALISRAAMRRLAREFLEDGDTDMLEKLLMAEGILLEDGAFDTDRFPQIEWGRPADNEGEMVKVVYLRTPAYFVNYVTVQRTGWEWSYRGNFDGEWPDLGRHRMPLNDRALLSLVDTNGLVEHFDEQFRSQSEDGDEESDWRSYWVLQDVKFGGHSEDEKDEDRTDAPNAGV